MGFLGEKSLIIAISAFLAVPAQANYCSSARGGDNSLPISGSIQVSASGAKAQRIKAQSESLLRALPPHVKSCLRRKRTVVKIVPSISARGLISADRKRARGRCVAGKLSQRGQNTIQVSASCGSVKNLAHEVGTIVKNCMNRQYWMWKRMYRKKGSCAPADPRFVYGRSRRNDPGNSFSDSFAALLLGQRTAVNFANKCNAQASFMKNVIFRNQVPNCGGGGMPPPPIASPARDNQQRPAPPARIQAPPPLHQPIYYGEHTRAGSGDRKGFFQSIFGGWRKYEAPAQTPSFGLDSTPPWMRKTFGDSI